MLGPYITAAQEKYFLLNLDPQKVLDFSRYVWKRMNKNFTTA